MLHLTDCKILVSLSFFNLIRNYFFFFFFFFSFFFIIVSLNWCWQHYFRDMIKKHFISRTRDSLKFYRLSGATFYDSINTVEEYGALGDTLHEISFYFLGKQNENYFKILFADFLPRMLSVIWQFLRAYANYTYPQHVQDHQDRHSPFFFKFYY